MRKKIFFNLLIVIFCLSLIFSMASITRAGNGGGGSLNIKNPLTEGTQFEDIIDNLIDFIFNVAIVLAPLTTIAAGFLLVTAGGNLEQVNRAKAMIMWSIVGFLIILLAKGIMAVIMNLLGVS